VLPFLLHEKASAIAGVPGLDFVVPRVTMDDVGGLTHLRTWLRRVKAAMSVRAREAGVDQPKGVLLLGPGGTGKSLVAQALAHDFHVPLVRLRLSDFYAAELGQTEARVKQATDRITALGRCVVLLDEMDKAFGGAQSSDKTDGGATSRLVGHFLTWMDDNTTGAFVVFTANNLQNVPPELFRNGRIDRTFVFMHPDEEARRDVLQLHLAKRGHTLHEIAHHDDITDLVERLDGFLQAEIEQVVKEAGFMHHLAREDAVAAGGEGEPSGLVPFTVEFLRQAIAEANPMVKRNPDGLDYYHRQLGSGAQLAGPLPRTYRARGPEALTSMDR
jgi:SpoVK/Ycf46/Vps4 family AAA+-type ATPase